MNQKRDQVEGLGELNVLVPAPIPPRALPASADEVRCSVCERTLMRTPRDGRARAIMIKCRHCGALQHRHL